MRADLAERTEIRDYDPAFLADVLQGLAAARKSLPARWFYDRRGSELFEEITRLPEYYPTRTEIGLLEAAAGHIARQVGRGRVVVEFGSGSSTKTPLLLRAIDPVAYVPIDISGDFLRASAAALAAGFPDLVVEPLEGDFTHPLRLPPSLAGRPMLGFFPGSTIGNLTPYEAVDLLRAMAGTLGDGAMLLIGIDRKKDVAILEAAYDDAAGVTAAFNLNLLHRINRELDGDIPVDRFAHVARYDMPLGRIELHLRAERDIAFTVAGRRFGMAAGETIHSENSHKYTLDEARMLLRAAGWLPLESWTDTEDRFGLYLASATR